MKTSADTWKKWVINKKNFDVQSASKGRFKNRLQLLQKKVTWCCWLCVVISVLIFADTTMTLLWLNPVTPPDGLFAGFPWEYRILPLCPFCIQVWLKETHFSFCLGLRLHRLGFLWSDEVIYYFWANPMTREMSYFNCSNLSYVSHS